MNESIKLKLPLIGIKEISTSPAFIHELFREYKKADNQKIIEWEKEFGRYIKYTEQLKTPIDFLFPIPESITNIVQKLNEGAPLEIVKQRSLPLVCYHLDGLIQISKVKKEQWKSAWANLMYDLGEFKLDEIFFDQNEKNNEENGKTENDKMDKDIRHINIEDLIPHIYKLGDNWHVWWANIPEAQETIEKIWNRITREEVQIISVDDDPNFADLFLGTKQNKALLPIEIKEKDDLDKKDISRNLIWINPITHYTGATGAKVKQQIDHIIDESKKDHLLVFVIDLIFKESQESTVIKGDELIRHLRNKKRNVLIVGITGGTSPFIINSAEKAGADIVVFKKRGGDPENIVGHSRGGNPIGVFDLLWAVSWNVSVWRLLEEYKKNYINKKNSEFENIAAKFFSNTENASPFWKIYLDEWKTEINKEKIKRLFR
ncbi:MAG: hypothetical protein PVH61_09245 [Candidatus Aminicenantes bacterium]